jgi:hypothetical protein
LSQQQQTAVEPKQAAFDSEDLKAAVAKGIADEATDDVLFSCNICYDVSGSLVPRARQCGQDGSQPTVVWLVVRLARS